MTPYPLYPFQQRGIDALYKLIDAGITAPMMQSPTGSGKGVMISHIISQCHKGQKRVLFLVHSSEILYQISSYLHLSGIAHGIIKAKVKHEHHHLVQLATFQTIRKRANNPDIKQADVIIVDEAHHATAPTFYEVINKYRKNIVIGFSATPARDSGKGLGDLFTEMVQVATIDELVKLGHLVPMRIYAPVRPDLKGVKVGKDYHNGQLQEAMMKPGVVGGVLEHWKQYGQNRKTIIFAAGVKHSKALCDEFSAAGISIAHVDGKTLTVERAAIVDSFKAGKITVIVNCEVLTEGVDVPDIGCVVLARPTKSLVMYLQMVGRGMRANDGKDDCILLDHAGAVYEHGRPEEPIEWKLSSEDKTINKVNAARKEKGSEPIVCPVCGLQYTGRLDCPGCGNIPTVKQLGKDASYYIDGTLGELIKKAKVSEPKSLPPRSQTPEEFFRQLLGTAAIRGYNPKWAGHIFKERFGHWPPDHYFKMALTRFPSAEVKEYLRASDSAYRKSRIRSTGEAIA